RVLTYVLEVAPVHGSAIDIDCRTEHELHATGAGVPSHLRADLFRQFRVPGCRQRHPASECRRGSQRAHSERAIAHLEGWNPQMGNRMRTESGAADQADLLIQSKGMEELLDSLVCGGRRIRDMGSDQRERKRES